MEYREVINYLYEMLPMYQRIGKKAFKKDLSNTKKLCKHLSNPQKSFKSIHIAGTNGKGSSSHMLAAILSKAGYKTGLYTSPHLKHFTERIKVDGIPVSEDFIVKFVERLKPAIGNIRPSFFELTVAMAFEYFSQEQVDFAVIEVGLGGRLDSTNVIKPEVSLITNISYDHQEMLGETLEEIAYEKAGIIKKGIPVIIGEKNSATNKVFRQVARNRKTSLLFSSDKYAVADVRQKDGKLQVKVDYSDPEKRQTFVMDTPGKSQVKNIPGVLTVIEQLNELGYPVTLPHVKKGLSHYQEETGLKGRWQIIQNKPLIIADIAHNKAGLQNIVEQLEEMKYKNLYFILGFTKEKDISTILPMFPRDASFIFCQAKVPRAMDAKWLALKAALYEIHGEVIPDVNDAVQAAKEKAGEEDIIFIGGSTFVVAELEDL
jgi:dihydrofolate synthase/folylpolyglutamate synthase